MPRAPDSAPYLRSGLHAHGVHDVLVAGPQDHLTPSHEVHDDATVDALGEQQGRGRVPSVVQSGVSDPRDGQQRLPMAVVSSRVGGCAVRCGEHKTQVVPCGAGGEPILNLGPAVFEELGEHLRWDREEATPGTGLRVVEAQAPAVATWALSWSAVRLCTAASVFPWLSLELAADGQGPGAQVDVAPLQAEGFPPDEARVRGPPTTGRRCARMLRQPGRAGHR